MAQEEEARWHIIINSDIVIIIGTTPCIDLMISFRDNKYCGLDIV